MRLRSTLGWAAPALLLAWPARHSAVGPASARCCAAGAAPAVRSLKNARVKAARALLRRRGRERAGALLVEGHRLVLDALDTGCKADALFYTECALGRGEYGHRLRGIVEDGRVEGGCVLVSDEVMESISDTVTPQGCVAVVSQPRIALPKTSSLVGFAFYRLGCSWGAIVLPLLLTVSMMSIPSVA
jgi:RNA 2'-O ribose methyltransferase substrate binding